MPNTYIDVRHNAYAAQNMSWCEVMKISVDEHKAKTTIAKLMGGTEPLCPCARGWVAGHMAYMLGALLEEKRNQR